MSQTIKHTPAAVKARIAGDRAPKTRPLSQGARGAHYDDQNILRGQRRRIEDGESLTRFELTPRQRRRMDHKANHAMVGAK